MEEIRKHIKSAYDMLGRIRVSGDAVDLMAASRAALREAFRLAGDPAERAGQCPAPTVEEEETDGQADSG